MLRITYRTSQRTAVSVGPVGAVLIFLAVLAVAAYLAIRAAEALVVLAFFYGVARLIRSVRRGRHRS